jgi:glycine/D-amino acid oxidase-like deaminating enzyme
MTTLQESNKLAETIVDAGGVWLLLRPNASRHIEVEPIAVDKLWTGRMVVHVRAIEGKPFVRKDNYGEGYFRTRTAYKHVFPEQLKAITPDKEVVGKKE